MNLDLEDKVFLIGGSSQGIGFSIARCFLDEGAKVVITGRDSKALGEAQSILREKYGENIFALEGDLSNLDTVKKNIEKTISRFKKLDGVIANVGNGSEPMEISEYENTYQKSYEVNVKSSMILVQESIPYLKKNGGSVTFIGSIAGIEDIKAPLAYSMHKAALVSAAKKLSRTLSADKIRVNLVAPGNIFVPGGVWDRKKSQDEKGVLDYLSTEVPLNTLGDPEDIGYLCVFLASKKAKFITGSVIVADGGQTRSY